MILSLNIVKKIITISSIVWIIIGVADVIITNIYNTNTLFQFYLLFPTNFPSILVYFMIAFPSILANRCYTDGKFDFRCTVCIKSTFLALVVTISFGLSPLLCLPIVIYFFARRAKRKMEAIPSYGDSYGRMRNMNLEFVDNIISVVPKSNLIWHNHTYLRCLYFTIYHLNSLQLQGEFEVVQKFFLNALMDIIALNKDICKYNYVMNRSLTNKLDNIWCKYFVDRCFANCYHGAPFHKYYSYARQYIYMLIYIFCIEIGLFWIFIESTDDHNMYNNVLITTWFIRDCLHFVLFIVIIWMYFERIKSEIKYRYCWMNLGYSWMRGNGIDNKFWYLMHVILWFNIVGNKIDDIMDQYIADIDDIHHDGDNKWMNQIILEYCIGHQYSTNNFNEMDGIKEKWYKTIYGNMSSPDDAVTWKQEILSLLSQIA